MRVVMASPTSILYLPPGVVDWPLFDPCSPTDGMKSEEIAATLGSTTEDGKRQCPVTCTILSERIVVSSPDRGDGEGVERARTIGRRFGEHETPRRSSITTGPPSGDEVRAGTSQGLAGRRRAPAA